MTEHDKARPLSGEIMTGASGSGRAAPAHAFTDVQFETVSRERADAAAGEQRATSPREDVRGFDMLRPQDGPDARREHTRRAGPAFWLAGLVIVFGAFWVSGGHALVRQLPIPAILEKQGPLRLGTVESRVEQRADGAVLFVEGSVENRGASPRAVPPLTITVNLEGGRTDRYFLGTNEAVLAPGERYSFSSRMEAPTNEVQSVSVTFREGTP